MQICDLFFNFAIAGSRSWKQQEFFFYRRFRLLGPSKLHPTSLNFIVIFPSLVYPVDLISQEEASKMKVGWEWSEDGLTVPQISPRSVKKSRHFHSRLFDQFFNCKTSSLFRCPMQCFFNACPLLFSVWFLVFLRFCDMIIKSSDINSVKFLNFLW